MRGDRVMIIIAPFCEVVCELETRGVCGGVFEVDNDKLFVGVGWVEKGGFAGWFEAEDIAVLCLSSVSSHISHSENKGLHRYVQIQAVSSLQLHLHNAP